MLLWRLAARSTSLGDASRRFAASMMCTSSTQACLVLELVSGAPPAPRGGHTATLVGSDIFVIGGANSQATLGDVYRLDLVRKRWTKLEQPAGLKLSNRTSHAAVATTAGRLFLFGGYDAEGNFLNDLWVLRPTLSPPFSPDAPDVLETAALAWSRPAGEPCPNLEKVILSPSWTSSSFFSVATPRREPRPMTCTCTTSPSRRGSRSLFLEPAQAHDRRTVQRGTDTSWWWLGVAVAVSASVMSGALILWPCAGRRDGNLTTVFAIRIALRRRDRRRHQ
ncbi:unnamed protein product [Durusdinium trenchii]|uniref:Uncharacterized protein n=1 Tax=Durusdinium trenchii TaxID=1381693 RepID=A0ABP0RFJ1_9DINO